MDVSGRCHSRRDTSINRPPSTDFSHELGISKGNGNGRESEALVVLSHIMNIKQADGNRPPTHMAVPGEIFRTRRLVRGGEHFGPLPEGDCGEESRRPTGWGWLSRGSS